MKRSHYFLPTLKETPKEAEIISHQLMLRAGMIRQLASGIYSWLPLGLKVLRKVEKIVREEQNAAGALEMLMPTLQPAELWIKSGRYEDYGKEMLKIEDRHGRDLLYGPTNEEVITDIVRQEVKSYKDLPKNLYHIQWKFRDEIRPRFGLMRGREFLMKDNYSFDLDENAARISYYKMFLAYLKTFAKIGVKAIPMQADTGPIGGDLSHEFIILAETGESGVYCDKALLEMDVLAEDLSYDQDLEPFFKKITSHYAATDEVYDEAICPLSQDQLAQARGIEVGHIFNFGTKYSEPLGAVVTHADGTEKPLHMGSYGIGISRIVAAVIEANHDENGMIWPESIAPFTFGLINLKTGDEACDTLCDTIYKDLTKLDFDVLYDDRDARAGGKFADMDLIGTPWQIIVGPRGLKNNQLEIKHRKSGERFEIPINGLSAFIKEQVSNV